MADPIHFDFEKDAIRPQSFPVLDAVADVLRGDGSIRLEIQGHINASSGHSYGRKLSQLRAERVRRYLVEKGIDPKRLVAVGYEGSVPLALPTTEEGRTKNRRIELVILPP